MSNDNPGPAYQNHLLRYHPERLLQYLATQDYAMFAEYVGRKAVPPHAQALANVLEMVEQTPDARVIVTEPPRHLKSWNCSFLFPTWCLGRGFTGRGPIRRAALCSYGAELATDFSTEIRAEFEQAETRTRKVFPSVNFGAGRLDNWRLRGARANEATMIAVGVGGALTGKGFDLLVIDDPIKNAEEALSQTARDKHWRWYQQVVRTRLQPGARVLVVMTRWHHDDLVGRLLDPDISPNWDQWQVFHYPAIDESGEALWPEQFPVEALEAIRDDVGERAFEALYQGRPTAESGDVFERAWFEDNLWNPATTAPWPHGPGPVSIISWDTAVKDKQHNDYSAWWHWSVAPDGRLYVRDFGRQRMNFDVLLQHVKETTPPGATLLIEDKSSGEELVQMLRAQTSLTVIPVRPDGDKLFRAQMAAPMIRAGRVRLPMGHPMLETFLAEATSFPNGRHKDMVDSLVLGARYLDQMGLGLSARALGKRQSALRSSRYAHL